MLHGSLRQRVGVGWRRRQLGGSALSSNSNSGLIRGGICSSSSINSKMLLQYFCNNIILMKQILILYFCYLSRCHSGIQDSTRAQETMKVEAKLSAPVPLSLARTPAVQSAHADSSALANSITERSVLLGPDHTELVSGGAWGTHASGRDWPEKTY